MLNFPYSDSERQAAVSVEIHQPEIEALIQQRMASGAFEDVEQMLLDALRSAPMPAAPSDKVLTSRTGAELVAAMPSMPYKESIEMEHSRPHLPVSDATL